MYLTECHFSESVELDARPDDVFDTLIDVDRLPEWNAKVHHVIERPDAPLAPGAEWVVQMRAMGRRWPSRARAINVDHTRHRFEHRSETDDGNPSFALWSWQVDPVDGGSRLTVTWSLNPRSFWRKLLLARVRRPFLLAEVRRSLAGLDRYLRARRAGEGAPAGDGQPVRPGLA